MGTIVPINSPAELVGAHRAARYEQRVDHGHDLIIQVLCRGTTIATTDTEALLAFLDAIYAKHEAATRRGRLHDLRASRP
jgi:hypothetical protein